jgi:hypothetical protein
MCHPVAFMLVVPPQASTLPERGLSNGGLIGVYRAASGTCVQGAVPQKEGLHYP